MKIAIGADHRGVILKQQIQALMSEIEWSDVGAYTTERSEYPHYAHAVCEKLLEKAVDAGVLLCGTGVGMAIAANRYAGIYAALVWNEELARRAKEEDWANILILPADYCFIEPSILMVRTWLKAQQKNGVYHERIIAIDKR
jgi:ribose 5-phosphate isomerase B